jgi:hypothetical protein
MVAVFWVSAAHSQLPAPDPAPPADPPQAEITAPAVPAAPDITEALSYIKSAAADFTHCRRASACSSYFETFGVALSFRDGSIAPFSHVQRLTATSRDCIKKAKAFLEQGDKSLAVQWVMAARLENRRVRDWLGNHPDAVLEALHQASFS